MNLQDHQPKIRVVVRKRPMNRKELTRCQHDVIDVRNGSSVIVRQMKYPSHPYRQKVDLTKYIDEHHFTFDRVFSQTSNNEEVYEDCVKPIVHCAFLGAKVTCFAYGQTGSGKTYTMNGDPNQKVVGLYVLGATDIFKLRDQEFQTLTVSISFYEIYCGKLFDLLNNREQLQARQDAKQNVNIIGLTQRKITNVADFSSVIEEGTNLRITSQNSTNSDSSRSHAILSISLLENKKVFGKLSFIDLAGCERGADTIDMNKQTRLDGAEINKSLLALKECIRALDNGKAHTPFRGSKLTMVLKDSLTGFCRTVMIGNISPNSGSCQNTLNTLRYADRVKELKKAGGESAVVGKEDQLARELMLPRMMKNRQTVEIGESDEEEEGKGGGWGMKGRDGQFSYQNQNQTQPQQPQQSPQNQQFQNTSQNRKKSVMKDLRDDPSNSRIKDYQRGFSANPKQPLPKQPRIPPSKPTTTMTSSITDFHNQYPKQPTTKILSQPPQKPPKPDPTTLFTRQHIKTEFYPPTHTPHDLLTTQPLKHKLLLTSKSAKPPSFLRSPPTSTPSTLQTSDYADWQHLLQQFRHWSPSESSIHPMSHKFQTLVNLIMRQEQEVLQTHKTQLDTHSALQDQSLQLYQNIIQQDTSNQEFLAYTDTLEELIEMKIETLVNLKTKLTSYRYHLKEHEVCEKKLVKASESFIKGYEMAEDERRGGIEIDELYLLEERGRSPVTASLPDLPVRNQGGTERLFENASQWNITQSTRRVAGWDEYIGGYSSTGTSKEQTSGAIKQSRSGIETRRERSTRGPGSYNIQGMEYEEENDYL